MGLKDVDIESALRRLADRKIEEAVREGKFNNLPGAGKPLDLEPMPADENARLRWWALRILKQNDITPDEVRWRKRIDLLKDELPRAMTEGRVRAIVDAINGIVRQINTMGTNALPGAVAPISLEAELAKLHERLSAWPPPASVAPAPRHPPAPVIPVPVPGAEPMVPRIRICRNGQCGGRNPLSAKFCRRCGAGL